MGEESSDPIARLVMDMWMDMIQNVEEKTQALAKINPVQFESLETYLKTKYVDDVLVSLEQLKLGVKFDETIQTLSWKCYGVWYPYLSTYV